MALPVGVEIIFFFNHPETTQLFLLSLHDGLPIYPIAIQVLVETGLQRFQRGARSRHGADGVRDVVAAAVGIPQSVLVCTPVTPRSSAAACALLNALLGTEPPNLLNDQVHDVVVAF